MSDVRFDKYGVFDLDGSMLAEVSGGDITVLVTAFGAIVGGPGSTPPQNGICPSATVPAPIDAQLNAPCRATFGTTSPPGINAACIPNQPGINPACVSNYVC